MTLFFFIYFLFHDLQLQVIYTMTHKDKGAIKGVTKLQNMLKINIVFWWGFFALPLHSSTS